MVYDDKATAINGLIDAITAIERVLGITPNGVYSDTRVRLDILEARINNPNSPAPNVTNPFYIDGYGGVSISVGDGYPTESRLDGSLYLRRDGYGFEGLYAMRNGNWELVPTMPVFSGDLSGDYSSQTVVGIQGNPIAQTVPTDGYVLCWNNTDGYWEPKDIWRSNSAHFELTGDITTTALDGYMEIPIMAFALPTDSYASVIVNVVAIDKSTNTGNKGAWYYRVLAQNETDVITSAIKSDILPAVKDDSNWDASVNSSGTTIQIIVTGHDVDATGFSARASVDIVFV